MQTNRESIVLDKLQNIVNKINNIDKEILTNPQDQPKRKSNINIKRIDGELPVLWINSSAQDLRVGFNASNNNQDKMINIFESYSLEKIPFKGKAKQQNIKYKCSDEQIESIIYKYAGVEKEDMQKVLFCRITSMEYYQDLDGDNPEGGGSYVEDNPAHERFNFKERNGNIKGFVESGSKSGGMNLSKIYPAGNNPEKLKDVLVIFVADGCIVGYYKNATVYSSIQDKENYDKGNYSAYNIEAESKRAVLLSPNARNYKIPRGKEAMGQSNVFYIYNDKGDLKASDWIQDAVNYVQINKLVKSYIPDMVDFCNENSNELEGLTSNNFGTTSYPLFKTVKEISEHDESIANNTRTLNFRYWTEIYNINGTDYRIHSQWGGHKIWNGQNNSISLDEKHRGSFMDYIKDKIKGRKFWVVSPNVNGKDETEKYKAIMEKDKSVLMGWSRSDNLGKMFNEKMQIGDLVLIAGRSNQNKEVFACGLVSSKSKEYEDYQARDLQYFTKLPEDHNLSFIDCTCGNSQQIKAIYQLHPNKNECDKKVVDYLLNIIRKVEKGGNMTDEKSQEAINLLEYKKQIILQGSPGTGKTRLAKQIAEKKAPDNYKLIQFHPAYSYEDFVRGIVAKTTENGINYETQDKVLAEMAENACENPDEKFVLIIDEINRANLAAVLGELIYALEYRGEAVESMYELGGSRKIILPENLYIIGTMNTADRSVGHIDYAIRRRFAFVNIDTDESVIPPNAKPLFIEVKKLFAEKLSTEFEKDDVMIGHSYFLNDLEMALEYEIKPILHEYRKDGVLTCEKEDIDNLKC